MPSVIIDCLPESAEKYRDEHAIVVVDVLRFTTTATTAISIGRTVYPAKTADEAFEFAERFANPLLVGELGGNVPYGFHFTNSPVQMQSLDAIPCGSFSSDDRPIVLISSSGSQLLLNAVGAKDIYIGCLRNVTALANHLAGRYEKVAILGAGTRGVFRREDQIGCSWIAGRLCEKGFECEDDNTASLIDYWCGQKIDVIRDGKSAEYLIRTGQILDLEFVLNYVDDLATVPKLASDGSLYDSARVVK